jgi:hypothetical protein
MFDKVITEPELAAALSSASQQETAFKLHICLAPSFEI